MGGALIPLEAGADYWMPLTSSRPAFDKG